jgi:hypothetical protein
MKFTGQPISLGDVFTESWEGTRKEYVYHYQVIEVTKTTVKLKVVESNKAHAVGNEYDSTISQLIKWFEKDSHDWIFSPAPKPNQFDEELFTL